MSAARDPSLFCVPHVGAAPYTELTLRDLFAAFALAGRRAGEDPDFPRAMDVNIAAAAFSDADAMLAERAKVKA